MFGKLSMSTKKTVSLICALGVIFPLSSWLVAKTGHTAFIFLDLAASLLMLGLLGYAAFREQTTADKSERVSRKAATVIFCGIGLWVAFCFYRVLAH
jgi:VIT1/CCC1 family predicted Fe2+/Mn2+ transporter